MIPLFWQRLFRRWFVEYNPLYLVSAACVLVGVNQLSSALAHGAYANVAVAAVAELYAWALIASSAFLMRIGLGRPAVMLALLTALYQCDPTLHTETCVYLGVSGAFASMLWLASFGAKLYALAWAMRLRLNRSAQLLPLFAGLGVVLIPYLTYHADPTRSSSLVALWLFTLAGCALWSPPRVSSQVALDDWGKTVLRRSLRATWALWAALLGAHVFFWSREFNVELIALLPVLLLLATRFARNEAQVWASAVLALLHAATTPSYFALTAFLAAVTFIANALVTSPSPHARARLLVGSLYSFYLAAWTISWRAGALPNHSWWLLAPFTLGFAVVAWKSRARGTASLLLFVTYAHVGAQTGLLSAPSSKIEWALSYVGLGFTLLLGSLYASWIFRNLGEPSETEPERDPSL